MENKTESLYLTDNISNTIMNISKNNRSYFLTLYNKNRNKCNFQICNQDKIYDIFYNFYNSLKYGYIYRKSYSLTDYYEQKYNIPKLYEDGVITICSDNNNNILKITYLGQYITIEYEYNNINPIILKYSSSMYKEYFETFDILFNELSSIDKKLVKKI